MITRAIWKLAAMVALVAAPATGLAQEAEGGREEARDVGIRVRALAFELLGAVPDEAFAHADPSDGRTPGMKIDIKNFLNHEVNAIPNAMRKVVFTKSAEPESVGKPDQVLAKFTIPDKMRSAILMVLPGTGRAGDPPFRVLPIDDSRKEFPAGGLKVMNLSPREVKLQLEKSVFGFKPGEVKVIEDMPVGPKNLAAMRAFAKTEDGWQRIGAGAWPHPGRKRVLQVLFENIESKNVEMRGFRDVAELP